MYLEIVNEIIFVLALFFVIKINSNNIQVGHTLEEHNWSKGKAFLFFHGNNAIAGGSKNILAICVGQYDVAISELSITGDVSQLNWQLYEGAKKEDIQGGTELVEIQRNSLVNSTSDCEVLVNPTIADDKRGISLTQDDLIIQGRSTASGRGYMNEALINQPYTLRKNICYLIEIRSQDSQAKNIAIILDLFKITK